MVYEGPMRAINKPIEQEESPDLNLPTTSKYSILTRIGEAYKKGIAKREEQELELLRQCGWVKRISNLSQEVYSGTSDIVLLTIRFVGQDMWDFIRDACPSLTALPVHEQMELLRFYLPNFILIDTYSRTWKIWQGFQKYIMCSVSICIAVDSPDSWLREGEGGDNRREMIESATMHVRDQMARLVPPFEKANVTESEVHALLALMLCETDMKVDATEQLLALLDSVRDEVLQDLQKYYREELGLFDFSTRLGNLMTICCAVRESNSHFQEFFRMQVALFDLYTAETQLQQMFL